MKKSREITRELAALLIAKGKTCATAESCTGGLAGALLTAEAGASVWFRGGVIAYDNAVKINVLGVPEGDIATHGAVSEIVALRMAEGACRTLGADAALAVTGVAGPDGGSPEKPVGTVWIGWAVEGKARARCFHFEGDRAAVREAAVYEAVRGLLAALGGQLEGARA